MVIQEESPIPDSELSNTMGNVEQITTTEKGKNVSFRCPDLLYNQLQQQKYLKCCSVSSVIKSALADYIKWQDKLDELKLKELNYNCSSK